MQKTINILIAGRSYPLKINEEEESVIMRAAEELNNKVTDFQITYQQKDKQDCLAMALLTYAVQVHKTKSNIPIVNSTNEDELIERAKTLEGLLDKALV